ncbi:hypothetical protein [Duganella sp. FT27W]|uniref:hypothetical protein n=1 Tax=Duganella sp. FT27W TaxID=2654636 RepID=UPI00128D55AA|nr:hypothetical protein [Duganella sp. FT27W]MPQ58838.1 hypothetical protein [Duganella sp. FT27W]
MAFRSDETARLGLEEVLGYLVPKIRDVEPTERIRSKGTLLDIAEQFGPVVDGYPSWHPLVTHHESRSPSTRPSQECGYQGLDHSRFFANGFITCPYGDGQEVLDSVANLPFQHAARITAERLDVQLYNPNATPIFVKCEWAMPLEDDGMIPMNIAIPLILQKEVPCWEWSQVAETWESMRPYLLGSPHGSRSSLFVSAETGLAIKKMWISLISSGMFGPIRA